MFIEFGILSYKLLVTLLYPIFYQIRTFIIHKETTPLYNSFMSFMSYFSAGIVYLFVKYRSRDIKKLSSTIENNRNPERTISVNQIYLEKEDIRKHRKIKKILRIFLLSLINIIPMLIEFYSLSDLYTILSESIGVLSAISFYFLFSRIFFKTKIYKHQLISLFTISFCLIFFLVLDIIEINKKPFNINRFIMSLLHYIIVFGLYSLYDALVKKHFEAHSTVPYHLMFFVGLFSLILIILIDVISYHFGNEGIIIQIKKFYRPTFFIWFLFDVVCGFLWLGGIMLTLYYFTPFHFIISEIFSQLFTKCIKWIKKEQNDSLYLIITYIIIYIIIIFSSLIYYEIIIIKLCSMEVNTFKYISSRQRNESQNLEIAYEENLTDNSETPIFQLYDEDDKKEEKEEK